MIAGLLGGAEKIRALFSSRDFLKNKMLSMP
jgi:hypothetical protein